MLLDGQKVLPLSDPGRQSIPEVRAFPEQVVPGVPRGTAGESVRMSVLKPGD